MRHALLALLLFAMPAAAGPTLGLEVGQTSLDESGGNLDDSSGERLALSAAWPVAPRLDLEALASLTTTEGGDDVWLPAVTAGPSLVLRRGKRCELVMGAGLGWASVRGVTAGVRHRQEGGALEAHAGLRVWPSRRVGLTVMASELVVDGAGHHESLSAGIRVRIGH